MSIYYKIFGSTADRNAQSSTGTSYSSARSATFSSNSAAALTGICGQLFATPNYTNYQAFFQFDLSSLATATSAVLDFTVSVAAAVGGDTLELHQATTSTNKIAGASIAGLPLLGSGLSMPTTTGHKQITLTAMPSFTSTSIILLSSGNENIGTAPTGNEAVTIFLADQTGTTSDPFISIFTGTAWDFIGRGTSVEATATSHILTEPAGVAAGDLLVACISSRIASTTQITLPAGWTRVQQILVNNVSATVGSAQSAGMMAYIVRGGSAPALTFTHPVAPSVALGRIVAYRNVDQTTPFDIAQAQMTPTATVTVSVTGLTTRADDDLIVALCSGGQESTWSAFAATDPATSSGTTADSVLDPIFGQWLERSDIATTTGSDTSLAIYDAVKQTTSATGNFTATASLASYQTVVAGAFYLAPTTPAGPTYDDDQDETLSAAETVEISQFVRSGPISETVASADTVAGSLDATRVVAETAAASDTQAVALVTGKAVAETAAAVETITGGLAYTSAVEETAAAVEIVAGQVTFAKAIAETASAADTVGGLLVRVGAIAETASAAETVGSLLTFTGAIAESASAAETVVPDIIPAGGVFDKDQIETAAAVDTVGGLLVRVGAIAESAAAAETITKAVSYTGAIAEAVAAVDTVGGLMVRIGAIAESASAAETVAGLLTFSAAIVETAAAAETIIPIVVPAGGTLYEETVLETLAANDEVSADVIRASVGGGIGHGGGGGKRRRHLFIYENVPANDDDEEDEEPKPQPKRKLRLKKAEVEEKIEDAIAWIEAGSPRPLQPMSQQALVAEVSAVLDIAALLEADRRRVERTIYRYVAALLAEEEEEEGVAMLLLAA